MYREVSQCKYRKLYFILRSKEERRTDVWGCEGRGGLGTGGLFGQILVAKGIIVGLRLFLWNFNRRIIFLIFQLGYVGSSHVWISLNFDFEWQAFVYR